MHASYTFLGTSTNVGVTYEAAGDAGFTLKSGSPTSDGGDIYTGLDRFGQLIETIWKSGAGTAELGAKFLWTEPLRVLVWHSNGAAHDMVKLMNSTSQTNGDISCAILIGVCSARKNKVLREGIRRTWLPRPKQGIEVLFFVGDGTGRLDEEPDTLALPAADTYEALPAKVQAFFGEALRICDFDWLFKCDDDTYVDLARLPDFS